MVKVVNVFTTVLVLSSLHYYSSRFYVRKDADYLKGLQFVYQSLAANFKPDWSVDWRYIAF
jgi:hypothetical protein